MLNKLVDVLQSLVLLMMCLQDMRKSGQISRLQNDVLSLFYKVNHMDNIEQRCGTCKERFQCPAWPGVCYPCPHYVDQDGIMEEKLRKDFMDDD